MSSSVDFMRQKQRTRKKLIVFFGCTSGRKKKQFFEGRDEEKDLYFLRIYQ
jgi:hypothetical protein